MPRVRLHEGPPTKDELAHIVALRAILRIKEWPAEDSMERLLWWMRRMESAWRLNDFNRKRQQERAAERKRQAAQEEGPSSPSTDLDQS